MRKHISYKTCWLCKCPSSSYRGQPIQIRLHLVGVMAAVALVQGASRGLGFEFCRYLLLNKSTTAVIATCRNPDAAQHLAALSALHANRLTVLKLDVCSEDDIKRAAESVSDAFGKVDLIVNSSAMLHPSGKGETSLRDVSAQVTNIHFLPIPK